jgi:uncharacterized protein (TIGR02300 family)
MARGQSTFKNEARIVAKQELGTKRLCLSCSKKFYDLKRDPIVCPSCGAVFEIAQRQKAPPQPKAAAKPEEAETDEIEVVADTDNAVVISLDDAEDDDDDEATGDPKVDADDDDDVPDLPDLPDDDLDIDDDDDDDKFLEDDDDDDDDVSDILGDVDDDEEV